MEFYEGQEKYVFISYAHKDRKRVLPILDRLQASGCRIWCDEKLITGENYNAAITKRLRECDAALFFLSENWMASKYCRDEASAAIEHFRKKAALVYLEDCAIHDEVFMLFVSKHALWVSDPNYFNKLLESPALRDSIGRAEKTAEPSEAVIAEPADTLHESRGLEFTSNDSGATYAVKSIGICKDEVLVIPSEHCGKPVTAIEISAFKNCEFLKKVVISQREVKFWAFDGCSNLKEVVLSKDVKVISESAFSQCARIEKITVDRENAFFTALDGHLYSKNMDTLVFYAPASPKESFAVPNSVKVIGKNAVSFCHALVNVLLPSGLIEIQSQSFWGCDKLKRINFPNTLKAIGLGAFGHCSALEEIELFDGVEALESTFQHCSNLKRVQIPVTVTKIRGSVFAECRHLSVIHYAGTKKQWKKIAFERDLFKAKWNDGCGKITVYSRDAFFKL